MQPADSATVQGNSQKVSGCRLKWICRGFHVVIFILYVFTLIYDTQLLVRLPHQRSYGGRFKFLTFWNLLLQLVYFGLSVVNDIYGTNSLSGQKRSKLQTFRDRFASCIVFPVGLFVVLTFWGIYAVDRELVFPKVLDDIIPQWLNHVWHTTVLLFLMIEKYLVYHQYPSRTTGLFICVSFGLVYQIWIFWVAYASGIWVYPILAVLGWPMRVLFLSVCWLFLAATYCVGEWTTDKLWGGAKQKLSKDKTT